MEVRVRQVDKRHDKVMAHFPGRFGGFEILFTGPMSADMILYMLVSYYNYVPELQILL